MCWFYLNIFLLAFNCPLFDRFVLVSAIFMLSIITFGQCSIMFIELSTMPTVFFYHHIFCIHLCGLLALLLFVASMYFQFLLFIFIVIHCPHFDNFHTISICILHTYVKTLHNIKRFICSETKSSRHTRRRLHLYWLDSARIAIDACVCLNLFSCSSNKLCIVVVGEWLKRCILLRLKI